jgi:hypothetical protein
MQGELEAAFESVLRAIGQPPASSASELIQNLDSALQSLNGTRLLAIWSEIAKDDRRNPLYIQTFDSQDGLAKAGNVVSVDNIRKRYTKKELFCLAISLQLTPTVKRNVRYIVITDKDHGNMFSRRTISVFLKTTLSRHFSWFQGMIRDRVVEATSSSADLSSFLHKVINSVILAWFDAEAATIFYYDSKTDSLVQAAGTGIFFQRQNKLKRSDIRYFLDGSSYTVDCYKSRKTIIESSRKNKPLVVNTYGEIVDRVNGRVYLPVKILDRETLGRDLSSPIGVARILNINKSVGGRYITVLQILLLEYLFEMVAVLGKRYIKVHSILQDQERATHGYTTDLLTISMACRTVSMWINKIAPSFTKPSEILFREEVTNRVRSIASVQEYMSHQLATVSRRSGNAYIDITDDDKQFCKTPYKDVFLRILEAKRGISSCYNRQELVITSGGQRDYPESFMKMPALAITIGELYLVVRNIVENAVKYTPKVERPRMDIVWIQRRGMVQFRFRDFGIGVPENERALLGRESFRGYQARRIQLRGNGLGLAVSQEVVAQHGGSLVYEPPEDQGKGSVFVLELRTL